MAVYPIEKIRADFPALAQPMNGKKLAFLDSAASAQKPQTVLDALTDCYVNAYANVHRGLYALSEESTRRYEEAREKVARFINAPSPQEIIFTKGGTEALNLLAHSLGQSLSAGDEVVITEAEHHANIVPWHLLAAEKGIELKIAPIEDDGSFNIDRFKALLSAKTKIVSVTHVSNVLGTIFPIKEMAVLAHEADALMIVDGCQGIPHAVVDVQDLGCDFYLFSGHKLYAPTGIGALYGRADLLKDMPPYQGGGDMIRSVSYEGSTFADAPGRFEAGTPPFVEAVGLGAAIDYVSAIGMEALLAHEDALLEVATERLSAIDGLTIHGTAPGKGAVLAFTMKSAHPQDIAMILDQMGVAVRTGHHCAEPLHKRLGIDSSVRASFGLYNSLEDVDALCLGLAKVEKLFG